MRHMLRTLTPALSQRVRGQESAKALAEQIGHLDEEGAAVATKARLELARKRTETATSQIVVIADVERGARIRRPAKQKLSFIVRRE